jgi:hypothetical protein
MDKNISRDLMLYFWLLIVVTMAGCADNLDVTMPTASDTLMPPTPTLTVSPSQTVTPLPSPSQTPKTPTQTPIPVVPTLLPEEQDAYLLNMIETNGSCELPCFMGVEPGVTPWAELRDLEGPLYNRSSYGPDQVQMESGIIQREISNFFLEFRGSNGTIEHILVDALINEPSWPGSYVPKFAEAMRKYSMPNILSRYGIPSRISLNARGVEGGGSQAEFLLFYYHLGISIHYGFFDVVTENKDINGLRVCPDYLHQYYIHLYLQNAADTTPLERMIGNDYYLNEYFQPLEKITALSAEDFYNLFKEPNVDACLDVPFGE